MKRYSFLFALAVFALVLNSCSERDGSLVDVGRGSSLALAPRFVLLGGAQSAAAVNAIRLTARTVPANNVVATKDTTVDSNAAEWDLDLPVPPDAGTVVVLIELLNRTGGVETIEWSGETAPITIQPGLTNTPAPVQLFQGPPENLVVTAVTISPDGFTLAEGTARVLTANVAPSGRVFWSSLDPTIATVDAAGSVQALRDGTARIVAVAGPRSDTVLVTATQQVASVVITPDTARIGALGSQASFTAVTRDARGGEVIGATVSWTVVNPAIATHAGNGRFTGVANGLTQVRATSTANPGVSATASLIVSQRATGIAISPANASIAAIGGTQQFTATVTDANGAVVPSAAITWRSSAAAIATVDANGLATARGAGSAEISAVINAGTPDSAVARAGLLVSQTVASVTVLPTDTTLLSIGETAQLRAQAFDANGNVMPGVVFAWTSANSDMVSIDSNGLATALSNGVSTIIASAGNVRGSANVVVSQTAVSATVSPASDTIAVTATTQLVASASDARGNAVPSAEFVWASSDTSVAVVSNTGLVTGRHAGIVTITAQSGALTATAEVTVIGGGLANLSIASLTTDPDNPLVEGSPVTIRLVVKNTGGSVSIATSARLAVLDAVPPHDPLREMDIALPPIEAGDSAILSHTFVLVGAAEFPDSVQVSALVDPANLVEETIETDNTAQTETKTIEFVEHVWTGAVSNQWGDPLNWSPQDVPHARSVVLIPSGRPHYPLLAVDAEIASLTQEAGSVLQIQEGVTLEVRSHVTTANIVGGTLRLSGPHGATFSGTVGALIVSRNVSLGGYAQANGPMLIEAIGIVYVGEHQFRVSNTLEVAGVLDMSDPAATVVVYGEARFTGPTSSVGHLTAGSLTFMDDFYAGAPYAFVASGTHLTTFGGNSASSVTFGTGEGVHFQDVSITKTAQLDITTDAHINGTVTMGPGSGNVNSEAEVTIGGSLVNLGTSEWQVLTTVFTGSPSLPMHMLSHVVFTGQAALAGVDQLYTFDGDLAVRDGGNLNLNGADINLDGNLYTQTGGTIEMRQYENLTVNGNASFDGGSTHGKLITGRIDVWQNFFAGAPAAFAACADCVEGGHTLWMRGSTRTSMQMENSDTLASGNHFGNLHIANTGGVTVLSNIAVNGDLEFGTAQDMRLTDGEAAYTLTLLGDLQDDFYGRNFRVANLVLGRSDTSLPNQIDPQTDRVELRTSLIFAGYGAFQLAENLHVFGSVTVRNGELDLDDVDMLVDGDFLTVDGGSLRMPMCECTSPSLRVKGNVTFSGGNNTDPDMLAYGTIYVGGNFSAAESSFNAGFSHVTKMYDYEENGEERTITLANAGIGVGFQHFGTLRIHRPTNLLTDIAVIGHIELDGNAPLIGVGRTATVVGDIVEPGFACQECDIKASPAVTDTTDATPLPYGTRRVTKTASVLAAEIRARGIAAAKPGIQKPGAARSQPSVLRPPRAELYQVDNTILAGGYQSLPQFIATNIKVVSAVTLTQSQSEYVYLAVVGNVSVDGAGAVLRLSDATDESQYGTTLHVDGNFATLNGGTIVMTGSGSSLTVTGDATFDGGSLLNKLIYGSIFVGGNFTAGTDPHAFVSDGVDVVFDTYQEGETPIVQTVSLAHPATQLFSNVAVSLYGNSMLNLPNGLTVRGGFYSNAPEEAPNHITGAGAIVVLLRSGEICSEGQTANACDPGFSDFSISNTRFDGVRFEANAASGSMYDVVFGTYAPDVDQLTFRHASEEPGFGVYIEGVTFETVPDAAHYHLHAFGDAQVDVVEPAPTTALAGARWRAEEGSYVRWGDEPNLKTGSLTAFPPRETEGGTVIDTYAYMYNDGTVPPSPFVVRMHIVDGETLAPVAGIPYHEVTVLTANYDQLTSEAIPVPEGVVLPPTIRVKWIIDVTNQVAETNEEDNTVYTPVAEEEQGNILTRPLAPQRRPRPIDPRSLP